MAEPKPIASLSSGLLARKGAARPAMRRQGLDALGPMGGSPMGGGMLSPSRPESEFVAQDDLGWNDMGYDVDPAHDEQVPDYGNLLAGAIPDALPAHEADVVAAAAAAAAITQAPVPLMPDVVRQQAEIAERMAEPAPDAEVEAQLPGLIPQVLPEPAAEQVQEDVTAHEAPSVLSVRKRKTGVAAPVVPAAPASVEPAPAAATAVASGRRAAFTLRLDSERHLKLRLASAVTGQSAQALVTAALDELLTKIPEIEDLAGRVPRSAGR